MAADPAASHRLSFALIPFASSRARPTTSFCAWTRTAGCWLKEARASASSTKQVLDFLSTVEANRQPTNNACAALVRAGVIRPWDITLKTDTGDRKLAGLHQTDKAALNALPAKTSSSGDVRSPNEEV